MIKEKKATGVILLLCLFLFGACGESEQKNAESDVQTMTGSQSQAQNESPTSESSTSESAVSESTLEGEAEGRESANVLESKQGEPAATAYVTEVDLAVYVNMPYVSQPDAKVKMELSMKNEDIVDDSSYICIDVSQTEYVSEFNSFDDGKLNFSHYFVIAYVSGTETDYGGRMPLLCSCVEGATANSDSVFCYVEPFVTGEKFGIVPDGMREWLTKHQNSGDTVTYEWGAVNIGTYGGAFGDDTYTDWTWAGEYGWFDEGLNTENKVIE